jgi:hypothetical protein
MLALPHNGHGAFDLSRPKAVVYRIRLTEKSGRYERR